MREAILAKNYPQHLEAAAEIGSAYPERLVPFQSNKRWKKAADLLEKHGAEAVRVLFSVVGGGPVIKYQARLEKVILDPQEDDQRTIALLESQTETTKEDKLWGADGGTLYAVSGCFEVESPIPYTQLRKAKDGEPISADFKYSYAVIVDPTEERNEAWSPVADDIAAPPPSVQAHVTRRVRDTATIRRLKALYDHQCQLCGTRLTLLDGEGYSEGHHLQPLGRGHDGPDIEANVLVLCPNCHALCDMGGLLIDFAQLRIEEGHAFREKYLDYHNKLVELAKTKRYCPPPS